MLDKVLFWVVLVWMIGMLIMAILAVRDVWKEASQPDAEDDIPDSARPAEAKPTPPANRS